MGEGSPSTLNVTTTTIPHTYSCPALTCTVFLGRRQVKLQRWHSDQNSISSWPHDRCMWRRVPCEEGPGGRVRRGIHSRRTRWGRLANVQVGVRGVIIGQLPLAVLNRMSSTSSPRRDGGLQKYSTAIMSICP
jgi:hypothetical protein